MLRREMVNRRLVSGETIYECKICDKIFDERSEANSHCELLHDTPHTAVKAECKNCDFERHLIKETDTMHTLSLNRNLRREVNSAKAGHISHNPDHEVEVLP